MGQVLRIKEPYSYSYTSKIKRKNETLEAKIIIRSSDFPPTIKLPFEQLIKKWSKIYPYDSFQRYRRYLKQIQIPFITKFPLLNGWGNIFMFSPFESEEKSIYYENCYRVRQEFDEAIKSLPIFDGTFFDKNKIIPISKQYELKL